MRNYRETCAIFKAFFNIEYQDKDIANKYNLKKMKKDYKKDISRRIFYFKHKKRPAMQGNFQYYPKGYSDFDYINEGAKIIDCYDSENFIQEGSDCDFYNFHHINLKGANKLTKIIRKVMCEK